LTAEQAAIPITSNVTARDQRKGGAAIFLAIVDPAIAVPPE
jgi:hypothetical protein